MDAIVRMLLKSSSLFDFFAPFFLLSLRVAVVLAMTPVLYAMPIPLRIRALLVVCLSLVLAIGLNPGLPDLSAMTFSGFFQKSLFELSLGVTLAAGITMAFGAFAVAGNILDVQIGFGIAQVFDPVSNRATPLLVSAFNYIGVILFFLVGGHHALLRGLAYCFQAFPVGGPWSLDLAVPAVVKQFGAMLSLGFALAAPVVFCLLLLDVALATVARSLPQMNMFAFGIPVKIVVGLAALTIWSVGMGAAADRIYSSIFSTWSQVFIEASPRDGVKTDKSSPPNRN